ncbi:MAG: cytochrome c oxidase assembly protein [Candidatus Nanopelagicales bacterium]
MTMTQRRTQVPADTARHLWWPALLGAAAALVGLWVGLRLGGAAYEPSPDGLPDPGAVVGWGLPLVKAVTVGAGTLTLGFLVSAAFLMPGADRSVVSRPGRRDLVIAAGAALVWAVGALMTLLFTLATVVALPLTDTLDPAVFFTYAFEIPQNVAYLVTAILAVVIAAAAALTSRSGAAAVLVGVAAVALVGPPLMAHGTSLGDHSLALAAGALHALAAAVWVGGLVATTRHALRGDPGLDVAIGRFSVLATGAVVVLVASGLANAYTRLEQPSELFTTPYGVLVLLKIALVAVIAVVAWNTRRTARSGERGPLVRWLLTEALLLALTVGVAVSMTITAYPRQNVPLPSPAEELLGFPFPAAPTPASVAFGWYPDAVFLILAGVLAAGYGWGVWRTHRRGIRWPWGRVVAWYLGVGFLVWSTCSGIAGYAKMSVEWHMVQHMVLSMVVPIFLVLGMPVMLALRAFRTSPGPDKGPREWLLWGLHTPLSRFVTHPLYVLAIGTVGLFGLYFTPLFGYAMGSHLGHVLMGFHFLLAGFLFYWVVLGLDPGPRQVPAWARLILLLIYISLHAFFAVAIMMSQQPLGAEWFAGVQPPWLTDPVKDSADGGGIAWGIGEIPTLVVMIVVAVQWARSEDRAAKRHDRQAERDGDAELAAYNARLAAISRQDERARSDQSKVT